MRGSATASLSHASCRARARRGMVGGAPAARGHDGRRRERDGQKAGADGIAPLRSAGLRNRAASMLGGDLDAAVEAHEARVADACAGAVLAYAVPAAAADAAAAGHILHVRVLAQDASANGGGVLDGRPAVPDDGEALAPPVQLALVAFVPDERLTLCTT